MKCILGAIMLIVICSGCKRTDSKYSHIVDAHGNPGTHEPLLPSAENETDDHLTQKYPNPYPASPDEQRLHVPAYPFAGTAGDAFSGQQPPPRTKETYYFDFGFRDSAEHRFALSKNEIHVLRGMASDGDRIAGARLYQYYIHVYPDPVLAEEVIELAPVGNGIHQYNLLHFTFRLPDGKIAGSGGHSLKSKYYLQRKQVLELTSLSAAGSRQAAARLSEYFLWGVGNKDLATLFAKFSRGDDSVLPKIQDLDATFKQGDHELIRKSFPDTLEMLWPF